MKLATAKGYAVAIGGFVFVALTAVIPYLGSAANGNGADAVMSGFMPHGMCYLWNPRMLALQVGSDALIAAAYFSIPILLVYFVHRRPSVPFGALFWMFALFILACGSTHVLDIWTVWHPTYWLSGAVKALTAAASLATAIMLVPLIPKVLAYKSPSQFAEHSARHLRLIADAGEALAKANTARALHDALLAIVVPALADCFVINYIEKDGLLRSRAVRAKPALADDASLLLGNVYTDLHGKSPSARAIRTGTTQIVESRDVAYLRGFLYDRFLPIFQRLGPRAGLVVPLVFEDGARGTFLMLRCTEGCHRFNRAEIVLLEMLARRTVLAIENIENLDRLAYAASHDALTGLANRLLFADALNVELHEIRRGSENFAAVLFLDVDRFKFVNDNLGHGVGDLLLVAIARRLETCIREGDTLARVSGDEFVILLCDIGHAQQAKIFAERVLDVLARPFSIEGHQLFITGSIGIALATSEYDAGDEIVRDADIAMYRAKTLGKHRSATFAPEMKDEAHRRFVLDSELRRALERDEFEVLYQPIVGLASKTVDGFEALVRWRHPSRGLIVPADFIGVAEDTGSIVRLGEIVLRAACAQMRHWQRLTGNVSLSINVNVSPKQFREPDYVAGVRSILRETGCEPASLHLEITETTLMEERVSLIEALYELNAIGIRIDVDDFGTGYSSLAYLHAFPIDTLKIDRSFVSGLGDGLANPEIVKTILALAHNLGLHVVAEGVETREQEARLGALGCRQAQGFLFAEPMNVAAATSYLSDGVRNP